MRSITEVIRYFKHNWTEGISEPAITQACHRAIGPKKVPLVPSSVANNLCGETCGFKR